MSAIIGIDPGRTGYIAAVDSDGVVWTEKMPETRRGLLDILTAHRDLFVIVEVQSMRAKQSNQSQILIGYGVILGMLLALDIRHEEVQPKDWQAVMLKGLPQVKGRDALMRQYVERAERLFPTTTFHGPRGGLWDGKAAACLIAEYGRRVVIGA